MRSLVIGGLAYQYKIDARVSASVALLAMGLTFDGGPAKLDVGCLDWRHTSNLWQGRYTWLQWQRDSGDDYALSIDADTNFDPVEMATFLRGLPSRDRAGIWIAPVLQSNGDSNIRLSGLTPVTETAHKVMARDEPIPIRAGGLAIAIFDLTLIREKWKGPLVPGRAAHDGTAWVGEDIAMCLDFEAHGMSIRSMPVSTTHYCAVEGKGTK